MATRQVTRNKTAKQVTETATEEKEVVQDVVKEEPKKEAKKFNDEDYIECRSITSGELIHIGIKSGERYTFSNRGDTTEILVKDLNSLKAKKSDYLYKPYFVVEDEEFLEQPRWKDLKEMYEKFIAEDFEEVINEPLSVFTEFIRSAPAGIKKSIVCLISEKIERDEFDSMKKIKVVDELCGSDLFNTLK